MVTQKIENGKYSPTRDLNSGNLELKATVLPVRYTAHFELWIKLNLNVERDEENIK